MATISLYASPTGNDSNDGLSYENPKTLSGIKTLAQSYVSAANTNIVVYLLGGTYWQTSLSFGSADSPTTASGYKVIWRNYPGEKPILSGGYLIDANDWSVDTGSIYKAPVTAGLKSRTFYVNGKRSSRVVWDTDVATTRTGTNPYAHKITSASFPTLSKAPTDVELVFDIDHRRSVIGTASISQNPGTDITLTANADVTTIKNMGFNIPTTFGWVTNAYEFLNSSTKGSHFLPSNENYIYYVPRTGETMSEAEAVIPVYEKVLYSNSGLKNVTFIGISIQHSKWTQPTTQKNFFDIQGGHYLDSNLSYHLWNHDGPGYYDTDIFEWVNDPVTDDGYASVVQAAVDIILGENVHFLKCEFTNLGGEGIRFGKGCVDCTAKINKIAEIEASGLRIGSLYSFDCDNGTSPYSGYTAADFTDGVIVDSNHIYNTGLQYGGCAVMMGWGKNCEIIYNKVHDAPYTGISIGWGWGSVDAWFWDFEDYDFSGEHMKTYCQDNEVAYNEIYRVMKSDMTDGAGIYCLGAEIGLTVHHNYLYDIGISQPVNLYPLYCDQSSRFAELYNYVMLLTTLGSPANEYWCFLNVTESDYDLYPHDNYYQTGFGYYSFKNNYEIPDGCAAAVAAGSNVGNENFTLSPDTRSQNVLDVISAAVRKTYVASDIIDNTVIICGWKPSGTTVLLDYEDYTLVSLDEDDTDLYWSATLSGVTDGLAQLSVSFSGVLQDTNSVIIYLKNTLGILITLEDTLGNII